MVRALSILTILAIVAQSAIGGLHGTLVLCVGGQDSASSTVAESACGHNHGAPLQPPSHEQEHDDGCCADVELTLAELLTLPRQDDTAVDMPMPTVCDAWIVVAFDTGFSWRGPPESPGRDPARDLRLAVVACTRLTL
jgi:hypothetical protein